MKQNISLGIEVLIEAFSVTEDSVFSGIKLPVKLPVQKIVFGESQEHARVRRKQVLEIAVRHAQFENKLLRNQDVNQIQAILQFLLLDILPDGNKIRQETAFGSERRNPFPTSADRTTAS